MVIDGSSRVPVLRARSFVGRKVWDTEWLCVFMLTLRDAQDGTFVCAGHLSGVCEHVAVRL